jgi:hypothetical protein
MQEEIKSSQAIITGLQEEAKKLTDKAAIKKNDRARRMEESDVEYAKERAAELLASYEQMLDEKKTREEEWAFQEQIDKLVEQVDQYWPSIDAKWQLVERAEREMGQMDPDSKDFTRNQAKLDKLYEEINGLEEAANKVQA